MTWRDSAACRDADPELFFPPGNVGRNGCDWSVPRSYCARCPVAVREACLAEALASESGTYRNGMWGGLTPDERLRLVKR